MRAPVTQGLVRRLLTHEAAESRDQATLIEAAGRVSDKLRAHLSKRIGEEGFRTLLARALALTAARFPHLGTARVAADGSLVGLRGPAGPGPADQDAGPRADAIEGAVALVTHLLKLLVTFIGEDLTMRILSTVWPDLAFDDETVREDETR